MKSFHIGIFMHDPLHGYIVNDGKSVFFLTDEDVARAHGSIHEASKLVRRDIPIEARLADPSYYDDQLMRLVA